ncbi:MAG: hypothetical protein J5809_01565 [Selenomonadaceae bacterium]|nr:hypothetical protein [Selenomonadaceae bacterium]
MRQVILTFVRGWKIFLAIAAMMTIQLISAGQIFLCGSILIGALLAFFYFVSTAARLEAAAKMNQAQAKKTMLVGLILRLLMISVVLAVAARISTELFLASAACFVAFYVTALGVLMYFGRG